MYSNPGTQIRHYGVNSIPRSGVLKQRCIHYNTGVATLYLVATPIGNLDDITLRALQVLSQVAVIAAEDTRHTRKLLTHHGIKTPLLSYHEHNKDHQTDRVIERLAVEDIALVSDAGMPAISDPGYELVRAALRQGHQVTPVPGPSAPLTALIASGLPTDSFVFAGYIPRKEAEKKIFLADLAHEKRTLLMFEVPHRLLATLETMIAVLGSERQAAVCRELTKLHEEIVRGSLTEIHANFAARVIRGEITLVVAGAERGRWTITQIQLALQKQMDGGSSRSQAAREVAKLSGWKRADVYQLGLEEE